MSKDGVGVGGDDRLRPVHQYLKVDGNDNLILDRNGVVQNVTEDFDDDDLVDGKFIPLLDDPKNTIKRDLTSNDIYSEDPAKVLNVPVQTDENDLEDATNPSITYSESGGTSNTTVAESVQFIGSGGVSIERTGEKAITINSPAVADIPPFKEIVIGEDGSFTPVYNTYALTINSNGEAVWDDRVPLTINFTDPLSTDNSNTLRTGDSNTFPVNFYTDGSGRLVRAGVKISSIARKIEIADGIVKYVLNDGYLENSLVISNGVIYIRTDVESVITEPSVPQLSPTASSGTGGQWEALSATASQGILADDSVQTITVEGITDALLETDGAVEIPVAKATVPATDPDNIPNSGDEKEKEDATPGIMSGADKDNLDSAIQSVITLEGTTEVTLSKDGTELTIPVAKTSTDAEDNDFVILNSDSKIDSTLIGNLFLTDVETFDSVDQRNTLINKDDITGDPLSIVWHRGDVAIVLSNTFDSSTPPAITESRGSYIYTGTNEKTNTENTDWSLLEVPTATASEAALLSHTGNSDIHLTVAQAQEAVDISHDGESISYTDKTGTDQTFSVAGHIKYTDLDDDGSGGTLLASERSVNFDIGNDFAFDITFENTISPTGFNRLTYQEDGTNLINILSNFNNDTTTWINVDGIADDVSPAVGAPAYAGTFVGIGPGTNSQIAADLAIILPIWWDTQVNIVGYTATAIGDILNIRNSSEIGAITQTFSTGNWISTFTQPSSSGLVTGKITNRSDSDLVTAVSSDNNIKSLVDFTETPVFINTTYDPAVAPDPLATPDPIVGSEGLMTSADKDKLDNIEDNATADQTKIDIDALDIDAATITSFTVGVTVPSDAKFTDENTEYDPVTLGDDTVDPVVLAADGLMTVADKTKLESALQSFTETNNVTSGDSTYVDGIKTTADSALQSFTETNNVASGDSTYVDGIKTTADSALQSFTETNNVASGDSTYIDGIKTTADSALQSFTETNNVASGDSTYVDGIKTTADSALQSFTETNAVASGDSTYVDGIKTTADSALQSFTETNNVASGDSTYVDGIKTTADSALQSFTETNNVASGDSTYVDGIKTTADGAIQVVQVDSTALTQNPDGTVNVDLSGKLSTTPTDAEIQTAVDNNVNLKALVEATDPVFTDAGVALKYNVLLTGGFLFTEGATTGTRTLYTGTLTTDDGSTEYFFDSSTDSWYDSVSDGNKLIGF